MRAHRPLVALLDRDQSKRFEFRNLAQDERVLDAEKARNMTAVAGSPQPACGKDAGLQRRQPLVVLAQKMRQRQETLRDIVLRILSQAAWRCRNDTVIDFEVGVSLSSPALPRGTSTLSSG